VLHVLPLLFVDGLIFLLKQILQLLDRSLRLFILSLVSVNDLVYLGELTLHPHLLLHGQIFLDVLHVNLLDLGLLLRLEL